MTESDDAIEREADSILMHREAMRRRDQELEPTALDPFYRFIERHQNVLFVPLFVGLILWPLVSARVGLTLAGGAVCAAGMIPVITGRYRSPVMTMRGTPARLRGLFSVGIGALIILAAWSL